MHAALDAAVFAKIAQAMGISVRYVGEEPFSRTTAIYNEALCAGLPPQGVHVRIIPRAKDETGQAISASQVRQLLHDEGPDAIRAWFPKAHGPTLLPIRPLPCWSGSALAAMCATINCTSIPGFVACSIVSLGRFFMVST